MKTFITAVLLVVLLSLSFPFPLESASFSGVIELRRPYLFSDDSTEVNKYIRKALYFADYPKKVQLLKAYIDTAEMVCNKKNLDLPALLHLARAEYFFITGDYNHAAQEGDMARKLADNSNDSPTLAKTLNFLGKYSHRTGFYKESIDYFNNSTELANKIRLKGLIAKNYIGLADDYTSLGKTKELISSLKMLIDVSKTEKDTLYLEEGYFRLGSLLTEKNRDFKIADSLLRKCLNLSLMRRDTVYSSLSLSNLGWNYYLDKKYSPAINAYNRSLSLSVPAKRYSNSANSYGNLGTIYRDMKDPGKALKYYHRAIEEANLDSDFYNLSWVYHDMSELYLRQRDTSKAYRNYVLFKTFSDSLVSTNNTEGLSEARIRYEADSQNKEFELLSLRVKNQRLLIYGYTGLFILSLAILTLLLSRARINAKRKISEMNRKISEVTQANLRQQMNPHFIFNTLNSIQYYMYQHDKLATNNYLTKFSSLMRKVLENSQHTAIPLRDELDALRLYLELEMIRFKDKFDYEIRVDEDIDTLLYKVPTMLIQPYVENSISHGLIPALCKGSVKIIIRLKKDYLSCIVEDNGIGRQAALEMKRNGEVNHSSLGTQIISSRLDLVNALYGSDLKTIYTDLKTEAGESEGTRVEIHIPILT